MIFLLLPLLGLLVSMIISTIMDKPITLILVRIVGAGTSKAFKRFFQFILCVVGISAASPTYYMRRHLLEEEPFKINEFYYQIYESFINSLQANAWALFIFLGISLMGLTLIKVVNIFKNRDNNE